MGVIVEGGDCPEGNYSRTIVWGTKVRVVIVLEEISWVAIVWVVVVQGRIATEPLND